MFMRDNICYVVVQCSLTTIYMSCSSTMNLTLEMSFCCYPNRCRKLCLDELIFHVLTEVKLTKFTQYKTELLLHNDKIKMPITIYARAFTITLFIYVR